MVGGHTRNKALNEASREVPRSTNRMSNNDKRIKKNHWNNNKAVQATTVQKQTQGTPRHQGRDAMTSISVQSEATSETNP